MSISLQLHPLIAELNNTLLSQNPYNPLKFIKDWATKKLKLMYEVQESSEQQDEDTNKQSKLPAKNQRNLKRQKNQPLIIKRRNAIFFSNTYNPQNEDIFNNQQLFKKAVKSQQSLSRIMISLKNQKYFQNLSWDQISTLGEKAQLYQTQCPQIQIQKIGQKLNNFYILVSGQVTQFNKFNQQLKTYYSGQNFCHQSFLYNIQSSSFYICKYQQSLICRFSGQFLHEFVQNIYHSKYLSFQKCLMKKQQFNYLDKDQKDKLILCFKQLKQVRAGQTIMKGQENNIENNQNQQKNKSNQRLYIVTQGQFSKCKRNLSGQLMAYKSLKQGDFFGEQTLIPNSQPDYLVMCIKDNSQYAYADKKNIQSCIDSYERIKKRGKMQVSFSTQ